MQLLFYIIDFVLKPSAANKDFKKQFVTRL